MPLTERPLLLICLLTPEPHIRVLWGVHYVIPYFTRATSEDAEVLAFSQDFRLGILPTSVEVKVEWLTAQDVATPTIAELDAALATTGPDTPRLPEATAASDMVAVAKIIIAPLALVHLFLSSSFLISINAWNLIAVRAASLGLEIRVTPLLHLIRSQTSAHAKAVDALPSTALTSPT